MCLIPNFPWHVISLSQILHYFFEQCLPMPYVNEMYELKNSLTTEFNIRYAGVFHSKIIFKKLTAHSSSETLFTILNSSQERDWQ